MGVVQRSGFWYTRTLGKWLATNHTASASLNFASFAGFFEGAAESS